MKYEKPEWEIIEFELEDVICGSPGTPGGLDPDDGGDGGDF